VVFIWNRVEENETDEKPRIWQHEKSGEKVRVEKFENGTWDTFREDTLIENFDTAEEAIKRGNRIVDKATAES
jgi:diketogulonate reductase-like aldo/keto reductase